MKKLAFILFFAVSIISCSNDDGLNTTPTAVKTNSASRLAATENVKLVKVFTSTGGAYSSNTRIFKVEVKNLAYNKKVFISHKMADGSWKDFSLTYINSTPDNTEIWGTQVFSTYPYIVDPLFGDEFVARYEVNGTKYWDNNGGQNYKIGSNEGPFLRTDLNVSVDTYYTALYTTTYTNTNTFSVVVDVRNISPTKLVSLVYTTDNWNTTKFASLKFTPLMFVPTRRVLTSPNRFGIERWTVDVDLPPAAQTTIKYAIVCKVNGIEYWDNNYGQNYTATK